MEQASRMDSADLGTFEESRPRLLGLAYRILGSRADAEDAVQDCFLKWRDADRTSIRTPAAWLTTVCTRRCLDILKAGDRARVDYVGPWLPEPIHPATPHAAEGKLAESLTTAFLLLLARLTPRERAAYLLRAIFDRPYAEVAATLQVDEAACRQLVARARRAIDRGRVRHVTPAAVEDDLLRAFEAAVMSGNTSGLAALLSADVRLTTDTGGKVPALRPLRVLQGGEVFDVLARARAWWQGHRWELIDLNGGRGAVLRENGVPMLTISLAFDEAGRVRELFMMRNPDKLAHLDPVEIR